MNLFSKTWINDLPWLKLAIKSVSRKCNENVEWHIAIEEDDFDKLIEIIDPSIKNIDFKLHKLCDKWPEWKQFSNGYMRQQWVKMTSHRVMGDKIFWHWDSDLIAKRLFDSNSFIGAIGRPIYWFSQFNSIADPANPMAGIERREMLKEVFQIQDPSFEWMRCLPMPCNGGILSHLEGRPEFTRSVQMMKNGDARFSEFNVIGQFSLMYFPDAYEWRNTFNYPRTWGGPIDDPEAIVCQFWSWSNDTSEAEKLVENL